MEGEGCYVCGASTVIDYGISAGAGTMSCSELLILFFFSSCNCQQVAIAFWRAMGGSEDEIGGLGEDSDS